MLRTVPLDVDWESGLEFEDFFEVEYERLLRTMYLLCRNRSEAEDLAQEALARAFERWDSIKSAESPVAYLYRIAFNLHRSALRKAAVAIRHPMATATPQDAPEAIVERRSHILHVLGSLPRTQCEALLLVEWLGLTSQEAAKVLRIKPESVRGRVHRARTTLRDQFGDLEDA